MQMQRRNGGDNICSHRLDRGLLMESPPPTKLFSNDSSPFLMQPSSSSSSSGGGGGGGSSVGDGGLGYIEHTVTRFDTLAGVAIKYGVEVADIKRMNGLTTDLQMFARKTLQIPLPGRHPPSPIMSNGHDNQGPTKSEATPFNCRNSDLFDSIKSLKLSSSSPQTVSPSMNALQGYYGLKPNHQNGTLETPPKPPQSPTPPPGLHRKCKSLAHGLSETGTTMNGAPANNQQTESEKWYDKLMRRRKSEIDLKNHTPEMILKQDNTNNNGAFSVVAGKGLALRPNAASPLPLKLGDSMIPEASNGVKKSTSTPSFLDTDISSNNNSSSSSNNNNMSIWPTSVLNLTADLQALSTAAITRPIFDGLPRPMSGRKNKAAID